MSKSIRTILTPLLIMSYVFGLRIAKSNHSRLWFNVTYILLVWSVYYSLVLCAFISFYKYLCFAEKIGHGLEICVTVLSIVFGIYYDKKFQNCLKRFDIIDNTLLKLGTITDYDKLRRKVMWYALGWIVIIVLTTYCSGSILKDKYDGVMASTMYFSFLRDYCLHINLMGDLINATILEYTGLKFDQINEYIRNLIKNQRHKITRAWENNRIQPHQDGFSKPLSRKCIMWITVHLYLELCKIIHEIDSIFGTQMTIKMAIYFGWIAFDLSEIFYLILTKNFVQLKMTIVFHTVCFCHNMFKFLFINYMCETVTTKAKATANILNRLSYVTCDTEIHEIISQFSLRIVHAPLRFYGIGLFQFGFKFLHRFIASVATVVVIILQAQVNKQKFI